MNEKQKVHPVGPVAIALSVAHAEEPAVRVAAAISLGLLGLGVLLLIR